MLVEEQSLYNELVDAGLIPDVPYQAATTQELQAVRRVAAGLNRPITRAAERIYTKLENLPNISQHPRLAHISHASLYLIGCVYRGIPGRQYTYRQTDSYASTLPWAVQWNAVLGEEGGDVVVTGQEAIVDLGDTFPQDWEVGSDTPEEAIEHLEKDMMKQIESHEDSDVSRILADAAEELGPARICLIGESLGGPFEWSVVHGDVVESEDEAKEKGCWVTAEPNMVSVGIPDAYETPRDAILAFGESVDALQPWARAAKHRQKHRR